MTEISVIPATGGEAIAAGQPMTPDNVGAVMSRYATVPAADFTEESQ